MTVRGSKNTVFCCGTCISEPQAKERVWDSGHQKTKRKESIVGKFLGASKPCCVGSHLRLCTQEALLLSRTLCPLIPTNFYLHRMASLGIPSEYPPTVFALCCWHPQVCSQSLSLRLGLKTQEFASRKTGGPRGVELTWLGPVCVHSAFL